MCISVLDFYRKIINNKHTLLYNRPTIRSIQRYNDLCELINCLKKIIHLYTHFSWVSTLFKYSQSLTNLQQPPMGIKKITKLAQYFNFIDVIGFICTYFINQTIHFFGTIAEDNFHYLRDNMQQNPKSKKIYYYSHYQQVEQIF